jgi:hypothetical protein
LTSFEKHILSLWGKEANNAIPRKRSCGGADKKPKKQEAAERD